MAYEDRARAAFVEFCRTPYAQSLEPEELETLAQIEWKRPPAPGTFKAMAAAFRDTLVDAKL